jgi:hypothetical protein
MRSLEFVPGLSFELMPEAYGKEQIVYVSGQQAGETALVRVVYGEHRWLAAFPCGTLAKRACTGVFEHPSNQKLLVAANGRVYEVPITDPIASRVIWSELAMDVVPLRSDAMTLIVDPWEVCALNSDGILWRTGRLSTEGIRIVGDEGGRIHVAITNSDDELEELWVDKKTGLLTHETGVAAD